MTCIQDTVCEIGIKGLVLHSQVYKVELALEARRYFKIILDYEYNNDIACSMDELKILNIYERVFLRKAKFLFKISKSITPSYINAMFTLRPINETLLSLRSVNTSNFQTPKAKKRNFQAKFNLFWTSYLE